MPEVPVKAVKKALDILSLLIFDDPEQRGVELTVLAQRLGLPANTAHNLLKTMVVCGYVAQNEAGRYQTGPQCRRIGAINQFTSDTFRQKLAAVLKHYTAQVCESLVFAVIHGGHRVLIAYSEPNQVIRIDRISAEGQNIYSIPTGRILVALSTPEELRQIKAIYGQPHAAWPDYETDLKLIRRDNRCCMLPDINGVNSFAVAVHNKDGRVLGALGCYAPAFRSGGPIQKKIWAALQSAAAELG